MIEAYIGHAILDCHWQNGKHLLCGFSGTGYFMLVCILVGLLIMLTSIYSLVKASKR